MAYTALYRKYRPSTFNSVVGQKVVINILINSLKSNHISHAYLFSGPRGTGKTSIAKIFAKAVNCLQFEDDICGSCSNCIGIDENDIDILEIDAASNNGVEEIRNIRENAKLLPSFCKYKVYIIDEVHMLSTGAFNALLKTLEEPPKHVIFILATTEMNKIPLTILSRCQRFDFTKISVDDIVERLKFILNNEGRSLSDDVVNYIATSSDGGLRDAINLLDQVLSLNLSDVTTLDVASLCGKVSVNEIIDFVNNIVNKDYKTVMDFINEYSSKGKNLSVIVNNMLTIVRDITLYNEVNDYFNKEYSDLLSKCFISNDELMIFAKELNELSSEIKNATDQKLIFEIYILHIMNKLNNKEVINKINSLDNNEINVGESINTVFDGDKQFDGSKTGKNKNINQEQNEKNVLDDRHSDLLNNELKKIRINNVLAEASKEILNKVSSDFSNISDFISIKKYNSVAVLLANAKIVCASDKYLLFELTDLFDLEMFYENIKLVENLILELFDNPYKCVAVLASEWVNVRNEYIFKKKNGENYIFIDENDVKLDMSEKNNDAQDFAMNLFGEESVSVK